MTESEKIYRRNAGIMLINDENKVFIAERKDIKGQWQMPQGGIDEGEDILAAARRELMEETGIPAVDVELLSLHPEWLNYDFPKKAKEGEAVGQTQKWFLFKYKGNDKDINVSKVKDPEFSAWKWATTEEVMNGLWEVRQPIYENVFKAFAKHMHTEDAA